MTSGSTQHGYLTRNRYTFKNNQLNSTKQLKINTKNANSNTN